MIDGDMLASTFCEEASINFKRALIVITPSSSAINKSHNESTRSQRLVKKWQLHALVHRSTGISNSTHH
uniref:Uncharacterized protein n=1 Tax=Romanomermis culicivorax TaxID=13658 RepID=A0A915HXP6_ROMCU